MALFKKHRKKTLRSLPQSLRFALRILGAIMAIAGLALAVWVRFTNPGLTETRLLLGFWMLWVIDSFLFIAGAYLLMAEG